MALYCKAILPAVLIGIGLVVVSAVVWHQRSLNLCTCTLKALVSQDDQLLQTVFIGAINLVFTLYCGHVAGRQVGKKNH